MRHLRSLFVLSGFVAAAACGSQSSDSSARGDDAGDSFDASSEDAGLRDQSAPDDDAGDGGSGDALTGDDGGVLSSCDPTGEARAVVVAVANPGNEVLVLTQRGGTLVDHALRFSGINGPARVAMRADGKEAVVAWGQLGDTYGVVSITLARDGSAATIGPMVTLGGGRQPSGLAYVSNDRLVLTVEGPTFDVVTLDRAGGSFAETARVAAPGNFPLKVLERPNHPEVLLSRAEFGVDTVTHVHVMAAGDGGAYVSSGTVGQVAPPTIDLAVHPSGDRAYSPADNPADPVNANDLTTTGIVHVLDVAPTGVTTAAKVQIPRLASKMTIDPRGRFLVFTGNDYSLDSHNQPNVYDYALVTVPLDAKGGLGQPWPESQKIAGLLFDDLAVSPSGHLVTARTLYTGTVDAGDENPIEVYAQPAPGQWKLCQALRLAGSGHVAIAPP